MGKTDLSEFKRNHDWRVFKIDYSASTLPYSCSNPQKYPKTSPPMQLLDINKLDQKPFLPCLRHRPDFILTTLKQMCPPSDSQDRRGYWFRPPALILMWEHCMLEKSDTARTSNYLAALHNLPNPTMSLYNGQHVISSLPSMGFLRTVATDGSLGAGRV